MRFTRSEGSFMVKLLRNIVLVLLLIIFISIVYNFRNKESNTVSALTASAVSSKEYKGVFIRDEEIILYDGGGALSYNVSDGGRKERKVRPECYPLSMPICKKHGGHALLHKRAPQHRS